MVIVYLPCGMLPSTYTYHSGKDERWAGNWSLIWFGLNLACQQAWHTCYNVVQLHMNLYTVVVTTVQGNNIMCTCMTSDDIKHANSPNFCQILAFESRAARLSICRTYTHMWYYTTHTHTLYAPTSVLDNQHVPEYCEPSWYWGSVLC